MTEATTIGGKLMLRIPEAVEASRIPRATLYREIQSGRLKAVHRGRSIFIRAADLVDYVDQLAESA